MTSSFLSIVAASCARGEKLGWSTALRMRAHGLEPGEPVGIGGPAKITLVLSRIDPDGSLTFGRRYTAGGQPCD